MFFILPAGAHQKSTYRNVGAFLWHQGYDCDGDLHSKKYIWKLVFILDVIIVTYLV